MPTYRQRKDHIDLWMEELGFDTLRASITPAMIRAVLQRWRLQHSGATCNKRRTALMHLYTVLDGRGARNPVREVPKFAVADPLPRGKDLHTIDAKLKGAPRCRSRAFLRVLLWTGMRPIELSRATPDDLDRDHAQVIVRTAKGGRTRSVPLTRQALGAWAEFAREDCWRWTPQAAPLNRLLKKWTGLEMRVYDLRHSYGTALAKDQTRLDVIGGLMGHSTLNLTRRYTLAAHQADALAATAKLGQRGQQVGNKSGRDAAHRGAQGRNQK
jgi:integrase